MKDFMAKQSIPGAVLAFRLDLAFGQYFKVIDFGTDWTGYTDVENDVITHKDSIWRLASISKSLTSALIGRLMDKKLIDLNHDIHTYLSPDFYPYKTFNGSAVNITVRQVMSHLAGLHMSEVPDYYDVFRATNVSQTIDIVDELCSYEGWWPAMGMISTASDLIRFGNAMISAYKGKTSDFLSEKTVKELWIPETMGKIKPEWFNPRDEYGKGWFIKHIPDTDPYPYRTLMWHSGGILGSTTMLTLFPDQNIVGVAFTNKGYVLDLDQIILNVAKNFKQFL
ncbi:unnamed protein product [Medioppia subpectinata]|uniref:Beta-lactamase-related domain-containing protein n=1 Tax=Medioppia subpectinata TaxID=1979941 RepID=A0A7R9QAM4_9ACAR|nr:unnamed protein product [Medioppia subpectinata]CAG2116897.1 unnamed protein product [Medioppia subpectinata]